MDTIKYFIYLLACHLNGEEPKGEKRLDWQQIYHMAEKHNVTAVIAYEIKRLPSDCRPGGTIGAWFSESFENTVHSYRTKLHALSAFISVLSEKRIMHELFKGVVLRNYYPFPELRVGSDADILVKPVDYVKTIEALKENGFSEISVKSNAAELQYEKEIFRINTELESINIQSKIYFATPFDDISDSVGYTYKLKPVYHLLYLVSIIAHHLQTGGAGIRMMMDIDMLIKKYPEININEFLHLSHNIKIGRTAEVLLAFSKKIFNTPVVLNFTFEDDDTSDLFDELVSTFINGKILGAPVESDEETQKKNAVEVIKNMFKKIAEPKKKEEEDSYYVSMLLEELGIKKENEK